MNLAFIKEKNKYMIPVDLSELQKGTWKNVTREQIVTIENIYSHGVEYYCKKNQKYYVKSKEHFLRSYIKIK